MNISIRDMDINTDIQGIRKAHGSDEHWGSDQACFMSGKTSLENGFFIQVAVCGEKIVGHAEWVVSDEPDCRFLYLGMLQVHEEYQKKGIGTKLIESGAKYAKGNNCAFLRTMPGIESGSIYFYQKCGFIQTKDSNSTLKLKTTKSPVQNAVRIDRVPFAAVKTLPFVVGLYQHASAHIWKVYNAQHEYDDRKVSSFAIGESYINIGAFEPTERASVTCWSKQITPALISEILSVGGSLGYKYLNFCVLSENVPVFAAFEYEMAKEHDVFMERKLMYYYQDEHLIIREMKCGDTGVIHAENLSHGWHSDIKVYENYLLEQNRGKRMVFVAEWDGEIAGYTTMKPCAASGPFAGKGIPEVVDFNVFSKYHRRGIGGKILDAAEKEARKISDHISLGVGLHSGYGSAQRMYVKRGYIPDGSGVWYQNSPLEPYKPCVNDDDLVLYFSKQL